MFELNLQEIDEVSGAGILAWAAVADAVIDFGKGLVDGLKAGYNA